MATLVSPGVSVTVTDESFYVPASAPTVPLIFIATADEKMQIGGQLEAMGTFEHDVVRTVTSVQQSIQLYGMPKFYESTSGEQFHGDARNEYGLFALNQFLGIGARAYVVRANVNLNDDFDSLQDYWTKLILDSKVVLVGLVDKFLNEYNASNNFIPSSVGYKTTVTASQLISLVDSACPWFQPYTGKYNFKDIRNDFMGDHSTSPYLVYSNGFSSPTTGTYTGFTDIANNIATYIGFPGGGVVPNEFTSLEAGDFLVATSDEFKFTQEFLNKTRLGANDSAKRLAIREALEAQIGVGSEAGRALRSESFDYNLILCPGYPEVVDKLLELVVDIQDEALVIADTPMNKDPDGITNPSTGWAKSTDRIRSTHVAYYYPSALAANLDGKEVTVAASGVALRTIAYSDSVAFLWSAPAGINRGGISGIADLGYVSGAIGGPNTFTSLSLNRGQRDALYQSAASGDINPLVFIPSNGFMVYGQKTSAPSSSAMDRINVSRLVKYIKRQLRKNTQNFCFEPNDSLTRQNLKSVVDSFLSDLVVKRGLYAFATLCDETNNTPDRIDRNELYIDVAFKPVKTAEFIYIPMTILTTGAAFTF